MSDSNIQQYYQGKETVAEDPFLSLSSSSSCLSPPLFLAGSSEILHVPVLSFGNILQRFPELLFYLLPYIADRTVWNSIVGSNKTLYLKSKEETFQFPLPPWPMNFKLSHPDWGRDVCRPVWSPDGTQIACYISGRFFEYTGIKDDKIIIFDQRRGLLRFHRYNKYDGENNDNNETDIVTEWYPHEQTLLVHDLHNFDFNLQFTPNGKFLISTGCDGFVKIWNYNDIITNGNNSVEKMQEWNIGQEIGLLMNTTGTFGVDVSLCSRFVAVLVATSYVILKDVQNNGETTRSLVLPASDYACQIMIPKIHDGHHSIFIRVLDGFGKVIVKIWRPYIANVDDSLTTILEHNSWIPESMRDNNFVFSHDNSMLAIGDKVMYSIVLYSIDDDYKKLTTTTNSKLIWKQSFKGQYASVQFTPDDNYLSYNTVGGRLAFWNIAIGREDVNKMNITYNNYHEVHVVGFSPLHNGRIGQRLIVQDNTVDNEGYYITSTCKKNIKQQLKRSYSS